MINVLWLSDNPVGKQQMKELKRRYGNEIRVYEWEHELDNMLLFFNEAMHRNIDVFESEESMRHLS